MCIRDSRWQGQAQLQGINPAAIDSRLAHSAMSGTLSARQNVKDISFEVNLQAAANGSSSQASSHHPNSLQALRLQQVVAKGAWASPLLSPVSYTHLAELGGGTTLGSDQVPFGRVLMRGQAFWPLGQSGLGASLRQGRLVARAEVGAVLARDAVSLPVTQLFLAGGDNSVRGYGLRSIGIKLGSDQVSAGRYLAVGRLEWQRPITVKGLLTDWDAALFVDAGAVADRPSELHAQVGVGAGLRRNCPL